MLSSVMGRSTRLPLVLLPILFLLILGLLIWHPWRTGDAPPPPIVAEQPLPPEPEQKPATPEAETPVYTTQRPSADGIGKIYMGREISKVMGHTGINWLERWTREEEEAPSKAVAALDLKPDSVIADIGAGSGYYTFRIAPLVPEGKVVAVDIQPEMIAFLEAKEEELGFSNVEAHLGEIEDTKLPPESIDAAIMVDAYHEFSHPREMMESIVTALRPGGRVILLEFRAEDPEVNIKPLHKMSEAQVKKEMEAVGLEWVTTHDFLPIQHFLVFRK
ncbi:MAG: class I SAM-dependent methyltransferase [Verrucomicrobiota bacterium]